MLAFVEIPFYDLSGRRLFWASLLTLGKSVCEELIAPQENLFVPDDHTALLMSPEI